MMLYLVIALAVLSIAALVIGGIALAKQSAEAERRESSAQGVERLLGLFGVAL